MSATDLDRYIDRYAVPILLVVALAARIAAPGAFLTVDEGYHWFERAARFLAAMQQGNYADTNLIGHPGVTTMWLGAAGALAHTAFIDLGWLDPGNAGWYATMLRFPVGLINALCVALAYPLLRRLFGSRVAFWGALLWATSPFLIAHGKILHVDGLLTSCMTLSLLAALAAVPVTLPSADEQPAIRWPLLLASGVAGGLALLTKSPSVLLLPMVGLIGLLAAWRRASLHWLRSLRLLATILAVWLLVAGVVWVALWPAVWVDLPGAVERVVMQVAYEGVEPHGWGNYFLGQTVDDPGPLFYPVALALRLTPWTLAGVIIAVVLLVRRRSLPCSTPAVLLLVFVVLFVAMLTFPAKKFDRYLLPVFPTLNILAAFGWIHLFAALRERWPALTAPRWKAAAQFFAAAALLANVWWYHPYEMAYYNPLLGGGRAATYALPVGWGEGLDQAGRYIRSQPDGCDYPVATFYQPVLEPFVCSPVVRLSEAAERGRVDYAVLYLDQEQRGNKPEITALLQAQPPVHTVRIHGINYADIYQLPRPLPTVAQVDFGSRIRLHSYEVDTSALRASGPLTLTVQWQAHQPVATDYMLFVHLLNSEGERVAQVDVPPGGPRAPTGQWQAGHYVTWFHPIPLPADMPSGTYWLALGLYDTQNGERLPVQAMPPRGAPATGPQTLVIGPLRLPQ